MGRAGAAEDGEGASSIISLGGRGKGHVTKQKKKITIFNRKTKKQLLFGV